MRSILVVISFASLLAATTGLAATTDRPESPKAVASAGSQEETAPLAVTATATAPAATVAGITTDQILARLFGHRADDVVMKSGVGGAQLVDLNGRFSMVSLVVRNPDGTIGHFCVDNIGAAAKLLAAPVNALSAPASMPAPREKISPLQ